MFLQQRIPKEKKSLMQITRIIGYNANKNLV